ncbi:MAG: hypothetical protein J0H09_08410, partial [Burkholderiales bacterium]|nr:hypothetical protein [Burkholderiales bacterium]
RSLEAATSIVAKHLRFASPLPPKHRYASRECIPSFFPLVIDLMLGSIRLEAHVEAAHTLHAA